jgi:hypothetical protein
VIGHATFRSGDVIELPDHVAPMKSWIPICDAARAAVKRHEKDFVPARNGIQVVDRATGRVRITHFGEKVPRPAQLKPHAKPVNQPPDDPPPKHKTLAAQFAAERAAEFQGEEPAELRGAQALTRPELDVLEHKPTPTDYAKERDQAFRGPENSTLGKDANAVPKSAKAAPKRATLEYRR